MRSAEQRLDGQLAALWGAMRGMAEHPLNQQRLYVTDADVMGLPSVAPSDQARAVVQHELCCGVQRAAGWVPTSRACLPSPPPPPPQVVAVLAPHGTTLEVPEPDQGLAAGGARRYR